MNNREVVYPENAKTSPLPIPDKLGQLYTGQPFLENAPWRVFPTIPEAAWMTHINLRSANPPPQAIMQMTYGNRSGNNTGIQIPGITTFTGNETLKGPYNIPCMPCMKPKKSCKCDFDCPCIDVCTNNKTEECPCVTHGCPIKYISIM
jgi:hypothetical protein